MFRSSLLVAAVGAASVPTVKLNNGVDMPVVAFAAQVWDSATCKQATLDAFDAGFRFIWSSVLIGDSCQQAQGEAIAQSSIDRSEMFIAGTVNTGSCYGKDACYQQTMADSEKQFTTLGIDKLDMLMLDYPSNDCDSIAGQWKAFDELYAAGRVRTIAVSNFNTDQFDTCLPADATVPSVNQLQYSVGHGTDTAVDDFAKYNTIIQAWSPLRGGSLVSNEVCKSIGEAHGKSSVQVALKWILQRGATVATQSTNPQHLKDDLDIWDFELSDAEMQQLNAVSSFMAV